jgi:selenoprotein W-related protein
MPLAAAGGVAGAGAADDLRGGTQGGDAGVFEVRLDGETIFSRQREERFPEAKELKQLIRDRIAPERDLGHSDRK